MNELTSNKHVFMDSNLDLKFLSVARIHYMCWYFQNCIYIEPLVYHNVYRCNSFIRLWQEV